MTSTGTMVEHHLSAEGADQFILAGVGDGNFRELATLFGVQVVLRGDFVRLVGEIESVTDSARVVEHMIELAPSRARGWTSAATTNGCRSRCRGRAGRSRRAPRGSGRTSRPWRTPTS